MAELHRRVTEDLHDGLPNVALSHFPQVHETTVDAFDKTPKMVLLNAVVLIDTVMNTIFFWRMALKTKIP